MKDVQVDRKLLGHDIHISTEKLSGLSIEESGFYLNSPHEFRDTLKDKDEAALAEQKAVRGLMNIQSDS